jgi:hypothetical protein
MARHAAFLLFYDERTALNIYGSVRKTRRAKHRRASPKIRHVSQSVEPRTRRERQSEKQEVANERRAIKKAARRHLKDQLLRELEQTD